VERGATATPPAPKAHRQAAPPTAPRRHPAGLRFERPKSTEGVARRDAAPRFRSASPRSGRASSPAPAPRAPAPARAPAKPTGSSGLDNLPDDLGLGEDHSGDHHGPLGVKVDVGQALSPGAPEGGSSPPAGGLPTPPVATAAGQKPPAIVTGAESARIY
jgi:hypothetical protein